MKVTLHQLCSDKWQSDLITPDGQDFHAQAQTPGLALMELGMFVEQTMRPQSQLETLFQVLIENGDT